MDSWIHNDFVIQEPEVGFNTLEGSVAAGADVHSSSRDCTGTPTIALGRNKMDVDNLLKIVVPDGGIESPRTSQGMSVTIHNECTLGICNCEYFLGGAPVQ